MNAIDRVGCFRGKITEHGVGSTQNGFPQFTCRLGAGQKFVDNAEEMAAFGLTESGWVDWLPYDQEAVGYLVMYGNDKKNEGAMKQTFQFENVQRATGWDGSSFSKLGSMNLVGKDITFWVEESEYQGNVSLKVVTIDAPDAAPVRGLRALDADGLKDLDSKFAGMLAGKKAAVKPASAPAKAPVAAAKPAVTTPKAATPPGKPGTGTAAGGAPAASTPPTTPKPAPAATPSAGAPPSSKGPPKKPAAAVQQAPFDADMTMEKAWEHLMSNKGAASDDAAAEAWLNASEQVAPGKDESTMTGGEWAKIAQTALSGLKSAA